MRNVRYYINQVLINIAVKCLEKVEFKSPTNRSLLRERLGAIKYLRQGI